MAHFVGEDGQTPIACTARIYVATRCDWHYVEEHKIDDSGVIKFNYQVTDTGYFSVTASKPGYANTEVSWSDTTKPDIPAEVTLKLGKGRTIGGQVVNEEGQGIRVLRLKCSVSVAIRTPRGYPHSSLGEEDFVITDSGGHWKTDKFPNDFNDVGLRFSHPDYISDEVYNRTSFSFGGSASRKGGLGVETWDHRYWDGSQHRGPTHCLCPCVSRFRSLGE